MNSMSPNWSSHRSRGAPSQDFRHYIIVSVNGEKLKQWGALNNMDVARRGIHSSTIPRVHGLLAVGAHFEVQAGMHGLITPIQGTEFNYVRSLERALRWILQLDSSWIALVLNSSKILPEDIFFVDNLRLNPKDPRMPDSEGMYGKKWLSADLRATLYKRQPMELRTTQSKIQSCLRWLQVDFNDCTEVNIRIS